MTSKHTRAYEADRLEPQTRLRANVQDLFAGNQLSGKRTQECINDIANAGNPALENLKGPVSNHTARNLRRSFLKGDAMAADPLGPDPRQELKDRRRGVTMVRFPLAAP